jgi:hypothetical protein
MNPYVRAFEIVRYCYASPDAFSYFAYAVEDAIGPLPASVDLWGQEVELLRVFHPADSAEVRADIKRGEGSRSVPLEEISAPRATGANEVIDAYRVWRGLRPRQPLEELDAQVTEVARKILDFRRKSADGVYYAPFSINSRNFRHVPPESEKWFSQASELLRSTAQLADDAPDAAYRCFYAMFEAINYAYSSGEVIFADEYGNWMLSVDPSEVHTAYLRTIPGSADRSETRSALRVSRSFHDPEHDVPVLLDRGFVEAALDVAVDGGEQSFDAVRGYFRDAGHEEAVEELAQRILDESPPSRDVSKVFGWLADLYAGRDDPDRLVELYKTRFESTPTADRLEELLGMTADRDNADTLHEKLRATLEREAPSEFVSWLIQRGRNRVTFDVWRERLGRGMTRPMAVAFAKVDPRAVTRHFLKGARSQIEGGKRRGAYRSACSDLADLRDALREAGEAERWADVRTTLKDDYARLPAFQDELGKI